MIPDLWNREKGVQLRADLLCEIAASRTGAEITAFYRFPKKREKAVWLSFGAKRGGKTLPSRLPATGPHIELLEETRKAVVQLTSDGPFPQLFISADSASAIAVEVGGNREERGILLLNNRRPFSFSGEHITILEELALHIRNTRGDSNG